jgi:hypothetical protein
MLLARLFNQSCESKCRGLSASMLRQFVSGSFRGPVKNIATIPLAFLMLAMVACGGGGSSSSSSGAALSGNWQLNLLQEEPRPQTPLGVSGFLLESNDAVSGSVQVPALAAHQNCGGASPLTGSVTGQNVTLTVNIGGASLNFTGSISSNNQSMSGDYQAEAGGCFTTATSGTWSAVLIPPLSGNFTGTLSNSAYMPLVNGVVPPAPISVTGSLTQSSNIGGSTATLTGTIQASGYPCFSTASLAGTISGSNVILTVFSYNQQQIGSIGLTNAPATISLESSGVMLSGTGGTSGLRLGGSTPTGSFGPCPPLFNNGTLQSYDNADVAFLFQ